MANALQCRYHAWCRKGAGLACASLCALLMVFAVLACAAPGRAFAEEYSIDKVDITIDAQSDGSLHIVEQRTFTLSGKFEYLAWSLRASKCTVNSVQVGAVSDEGDTTLSELPETAFDLNWREDERESESDPVGPGGDSYAVDTGRNMVYTFFNAADTQIIVQVDYTVENGITPYRDCADLYWQYVGTDWEADSNDVTCRVSLPVPAGVQPTVGDMVYAWGHGPADGTVAFNEDNTVVTYHTDCVPEGSFAEARVVFPRSWLTNISDEALAATGSVMFKEQIIAAEEKWVDGASWQKHYAYIYLIVLGAVSSALLLIAVVMLVRYGRAERRTFSETYWADEPRRGMHPAVVGRLYRLGRESGKDLVASVLHLANKGALTVSKGSYANAEGERAVDYYLNRVPAVADALDNAVDKQTVSLLFGTVARGHDALWLSSIKVFGSNAPVEYNHVMHEWQKTLSSVVAGADYFDEKAQRRQHALALTGALYGIFSLLLAWFTGNYPPLLFMLPTAVLVFAASNYMPHLTRRGANDLGRCKALKQWLLDYPQSDDGVFRSVQKWKALLVYAFEFGVDERVVRSLRKARPDMFESDDEKVRMHAWFVPWFGLYDALGPLDGTVPAEGTGADSDSAALPSFARALEDALDQAQRTVDHAIATDDRATHMSEPETVV